MDNTSPGTTDSCNCGDKWSPPTPHDSLDDNATALGSLDENPMKCAANASITCGTLRCQNCAWSGGICARPPTEKGTTPRSTSARSRPKEINGQNIHDWVPDPGTVSGPEPQPYNAPNPDKDPDEKPTWNIWLLCTRNGCPWA